MTVSQLLVWTALPTGIKNGELTLSVFLAPQLNATAPPSMSFAPLSLFPDFVNWPQAINESPDGPISFEVTFYNGGYPVSLPATNVTASSPIDPVAAWAAIFDPDTTSVNPFSFQDYSTLNIHSFSAAEIEAFVSSIYGTIGSISPTDPLIIASNTDRDYGSMIAGDPTTQSIVDALAALALINVNDTGVFGVSSGPSLRHPRTIPDPTQSFTDLHSFHAPLGAETFIEPTTPTLDFHQGLTGLNHFPLIMRMFNLVFDLTVPISDAVNHGTQRIAVVPRWSSQLGAASTNCTPWTATIYSSGLFQPLAQGTDYANRMLDLSDTTRFMVSDLDHDLAADRLLSLGSTLVASQNAHAQERDQSYGHVAPAQLALTVPALRSTGPQVIWSGFADAGDSGFTGLLDGQASLQASLSTWLSDPIAANLPVIYAEQLIRGHRVDVYTASDSSPAWHSLMGRYGNYVFGPNSDNPIPLTALDEGILTPGASQKGNPQLGDPLDLWVHESVIHWRGWGLSAQRPGAILDRSSNSMITNGKNLPQLAQSNQPSPPQLSAYFLPPSPSAGPGLLFPRLRFGNQYQFRARGVDLAGNSLDPSSTDSTTATALFTHYRYEPVRPPVMAGMAPFTPGEGTHFLVLLDWQASNHTLGTNGRWLFPPSSSELMSEEHGMLDGFVAGNLPNPNAIPASDQNTYTMLVNLDSTDLAGVTQVPYDYTQPLIGTYDTNNNGVPYFTGDYTPWTPYFPDPLSAGPALLGMPGASDPLTALWNGVWPQADPMLIQLGSSSTPSTTYIAPSDSSPATFEVTLPPAGVAVVRLTSALTPSALESLGVWQWFGPAGGSSVESLALDGQVWLLTPFQVLRMVHAVRLPLLGPSLGSPISSRQLGEISVDIEDPQFQIDEPSTAHIDVLATWTDRYDNPLDANCDPGALVSTPTHQSVVTSSGPAFRLTVPDPNPTGPEAQPMTIAIPPESFAVTPSSRSHGESATHRIGDTKHHLVQYTAVGTSRFAELFEQTIDVEIRVGSSIVVGDAITGLSGPSVRVINGDTEMVADIDYSVDEASRTISLLVTATNPVNTDLSLTIYYQPTVTLSGPPVPVQVLSSAPPKAPVISQVVPAWQLEGPSGSLSSGIEMTRTGGFLRVYLDRPWFSSGDGELLGVVTTVTNQSDKDAYTSTFPTAAQQHWVTMMGVDPINYIGTAHRPWPVVPTKFENLSVIPDVPYRPPYAHPPQVYLPEDTANLYQVWPYDVHYDEASGRWYADIAPRPGITSEGIYPPPPGYFIRLALCRFQPYSIYEASPTNGVVEVSPVVLATFAQPVPDRSISVVANSADKTGSSVLVSVTGPGYQGFRPPVLPGGPLVEYDAENPYAPSNPSIYGSSINTTFGTQHTSTMTVEVQIQNPILNKEGLTGDLAWESVKGPYVLKPTFSGEVYVTWGSTKASLHGNGVITLPFATSSATKMRLRICEIDYYTGTSAPTVIDTRYRRPFVTFIDVN